MIAARWLALVAIAAGCDRSDPAIDPGADGGDGVDASVDGMSPPPEGVPMFVAIGKIGRITTSCDGGQTWVANRSDDDTASCVGIDCDHHSGSSTGVTFGGGYFYASFGWGDHPARIMRSPDGVTWTTVYDQRGFSFAGVVWAGDRLIGGDVTPRTSLDHGATFTASAWPAYDNPMMIWPNARRVGFAPIGAAGKIALFSSSGMWSDATISSDGGATFQHPAVLPAGCRDRGSQGSVFGNGIWIQAWAPTGALCRSTDGDTWELAQPIQTPDYSMSNVVFDGTEFVVYQGARGYRSADGATWTAFDSNEVVGRIAVDPYTRTFVMVRNHWSGDPVQQRFFRSADGVSWATLGAGDFVGSHPITHIDFGFGAASATCPGV